MAEEAEWNAYLYPGSDILRNKLDIRDERLWEAERFLARRRAEQLRLGRIAIPRTLDGEHLKAIHSWLAQDVYDWHGQYRNVTIGKRLDPGEPPRWFISPTAIEPWLAGVSEIANSVQWATLDRAEIVERAAELQTYVNFAHPFREMNGRTARIFLEHVVEPSAFRLDFAKATADQWNEAARDSIHPGLARPSQGPLQFEPMQQLFSAIVVDRPPALTDEAQAAANLAQLGFARPASQAPAAQPAAQRPTASPEPRTRDVDLSR